MKTGTARLPLHGGKAPPWLFKRMRLLAGAVVEALVYEYGRDEFIRRVADPYWFQALSCVIGFDWHSSGTTTTTTGAIKSAIRPEELGIAVAGGKGATSRKAPSDIEAACDLFSLNTSKAEELVRASKMAAKVDSALVQDGYRLYHHAFFFTEDGSWAVVQQGMDDRYARRYHWLSDGLKSFVEEPHSAICSEIRTETSLDLTSREGRDNRAATLDLVRDGPAHLECPQKTLLEFSVPGEGPEYSIRRGGRLSRDLVMPGRHHVLPSDLGPQGQKALEIAYEIQPESYEELVALKGMGPKRMRALALISELIYGASPSWKDPARFSFAHGGKDGHPYPVDRDTYDRSIESLREALEAALLGRKEKYEAIKRLCDYTGV